MSSFTNELSVTFLEGKKLRIQLNEDLVYWRTDSKGDKITEIAEEGFICDGASIPRVLWSILGSPLSGLYRNPAVLHDKWYREGKYSRRKCDRLFLEAMKVAGVGLIKRRVIYSGVRVGAWVAYNNYRKAD